MKWTEYKVREVIEGMLDCVADARLNSLNDDDLDLATKEHPLFIYRGGATQGCLIPRFKSDWVVKFPFQTNTYAGSPTHYHGACDGGDGHDYTKAGLLTYQRAVEAGFGHLLAAIEFFDDYEVCGQEWPFYLQERCETLSGHDTIHRASNEDLATANRVTADSDFEEEIDDDFVVDMIYTYGAREVTEFLVWLKEEEISDLHNSNVGYTVGAENPVLMDYSCYDENTYYSSDDSDTHSRSWWSDGDDDYCDTHEDSDSCYTTVTEDDEDALPSFAYYSRDA